MEMSADYILFGSKPNRTVTLYDRLSEMSEEQRRRAENAFEALLPYIR